MKLLMIVLRKKSWSNNTMRPICLLLIASLPVWCIASAGIEYEATKTIQSALQATSVDRALSQASAYFVQEGHNMQTRSFTISSASDPVATIAIGFITDNDLNSTSCQPDDSGSCIFNSSLLSDTEAESGNLVVEVNFKNDGSLPAAIRSKTIAFYAMNGLAIEAKRLVKTNNTTAQASIGYYICNNPNTALNNYLPLGSISLEDGDSTSTTVNVLNQVTNALSLCKL